MTNDDVILSKRLAGQVKRYHVWPVLHAQSVGEHTWQVMRLYIELWGLPSAQVLYRILHHDTAEISTGDLPFRAAGGDAWTDVKFAMKIVENETLDAMGIERYALTATERAKIKVADLLEMYEYGLHEHRLGNQYGLLICRNVLQAAAEVAKKTSPDVYQTLLNWVIANPIPEDRA